jgi:alkanesulfonate monooxygenase SsuD/methylene tetrahydromethanopterin reductase-like flavin-dependent oxidoreductase (luciferase family)
MIKVWAFDFNAIQGRQFPDSANPNVLQTTFDRNLERLASLEGKGFEGVFFSEHHFLDLPCPCPNLLVAALSKMSKKIRIGVMGNVLAFHQPWRLVEEIGMLDYITGGRLEIGVAAGVPPEFAFVGIAPADVRAMYEEMLDYLDKAFVNPAVSHHGKFWNVDDIPVFPKMRPEARRRKWMTVFSAGSAIAGARRGYKICTAYQATDDVARVFDAYRKAARETGWTAGPDDLGLRRQVLICETNSQAHDLEQELVETAKARMVASFAKVQSRVQQGSLGGMSEGVRQTGVMDAAAPQRGPEAKAGVGAVNKMVSIEDEHISGAPGRVIEKIIDQCRRTGTGNFLAYHAIGLELDELEAHYKLWDQVIPSLAKADVSTVAA